MIHDAEADIDLEVTPRRHRRPCFITRYKFDRISFCLVGTATCLLLLGFAGTASSILAPSPTFLPVTTSSPYTQTLDSHKTLLSVGALDARAPPSQLSDDHRIMLQTGDSQMTTPVCMQNTTPESPSAGRPSTPSQRLLSEEAILSSSAVQGQHGTSPNMWFSGWSSRYRRPRSGMRPSVIPTDCLEVR